MVVKVGVRRKNAYIFRIYHPIQMPDGIRICTTHLPAGLIIYTMGTERYFKSVDYFNCFIGG